MVHRLVLIKELVLDVTVIGLLHLAIAAYNYSYAFRRSLSGEEYNLRYTDAWRTMGHQGWCALILGSVLLALGTHLKKELTLCGSDTLHVLFRTLLISVLWASFTVLIIKVIH